MTPTPSLRIKEKLKKIMVSYEMPHGTTFEDLLNFVTSNYKQGVKDEKINTGKIKKRQYESGLKKGRKMEREQWIRTLNEIVQAKLDGIGSEWGALKIELREIIEQEQYEQAMEDET